MRALNAETLPLIAYAAGLASILWVRGVQILGPSRRAIFMNLLQVLTALGAIVLLGEPVRAFHVGGGAALAASLALPWFVAPLWISAQAVPGLGK